MSKAPRVSLLNLLLIAGAVCAFVALYAFWAQHRRELAQANATIASQQAEVDRVRAEQGHLVLHDETKAYAVRVETIEEPIGGGTARWRVRVYLPELVDGCQYMMRVCDGVIPVKGFSYWSDWREEWPTPDLSYGVGGRSLKPGEHLFDFAIAVDLQGRTRRATCGDRAVF